MPEYPTVRFTITRTKHLFISARIKGQRIRLIVDTAAGTSVMDRDTAEALGLKERKNSQRNDVKGIGTSSGEMHYLVVPTITIGDHTFTRPRFAGMDLNHVKEAGGKRGLHGLLGSDFLMKYHAVIDYENRLITFKIH